MLKKLGIFAALLCLQQACVTNLPVSEDYRLDTKKSVGAIVTDLPPVEYDSSTASGSQYGLIGALVASAVEAIDNAIRDSDDKLKAVVILPEDSQTFRESILSELQSNQSPVQVMAPSSLSNLASFKKGKQKGEFASLDFTAFHSEKIDYVFVLENKRFGIMGQRGFQPCLFAEAYIARTADNQLMFRNNLEVCSPAHDNWRDGTTEQMKVMMIKVTQDLLEKLKNELHAPAAKNVSAN